MAGKKRGIGKFIVELIIVFIGVYGAFELNRYQEGLREQKIEKNYFTSFLSEVIKISSEIENTREIVSKELAQLEQAIADDQKPNLKPLNLYFGSEMLITKAGFNDDVFTQLNPNLSASLSGGYDNIQIVRQMVENFNTRCTLHLISSEPISFYSRSGTLKPQFDWYLQDLRSLKATLAKLSQMITEGAVPATREIVEGLK